MIQFYFGPTTNSIDLSVETAVILDTFGDEYTGKTCDIPDTVKHLILADYSYHAQFDNDPRVIYSPLYFTNSALRHVNGEGELFEPNTERCFSFHFFTPRIHRHLLMGLLNYHQLTNFYHTIQPQLFFTFNTDEVFNFIRNQPAESIDVNILLEKGFNADNNVMKSFSFDVGNDPRLFTPWGHGLGALISKTAVSLITETVGAYKSAMFTEKTLWAMMALNFPIWVGGYKQAELFKNLGFDVFDDVIDHSYQYKDNFIDRCNLALELNRDILTDLELAKSLRLRVMDRLIKNREHLGSQELFSKTFDQLRGLINDKDLFSIYPTDY